MFGPNLRIEIDGFGVTLRPFKKEWMGLVAEQMSSLEVRMYTFGNFGLTKEDEEEWFDRVRKDESSVHWAIIPDGQDTPAGITSINDFGRIHQSCSTGIVIFEGWRWKGVATRTNPIRTWYAAEILNRSVMHTHVRVPNEPSRRALERVGYFVTGMYPRDAFRNGKWIDTYSLTWLHPERIDFLYPEGLPVQYSEGVERARLALEKARRLVQLL